MIAIFDIDGILANNADTKYLDCRKPQEHAEFARLITGVSALPIRHVAQALACCGVPVFIFTARSEALRPPTEEWLAKNEAGLVETGLPRAFGPRDGDAVKRDGPIYSNNNLYMRPMGNNDDNHILKWRQLQGLLKSFEESPFNYGGILAFEDHPRAAKMFAQHGCFVYKPFELREE